MTYLMFLAGLVGLFYGGEYLVRGASVLARKFGLSPMVIGLTVVGFGTSAPELLVSVQAALAGEPGIAIGNVMGSNIANILLILGVSAAIAPLLIPARRIWRDLAIMLAASAALWPVLADGSVSRLDGLMLLAGLAGFLAFALLTGGNPEDVDLLIDEPAWLAWAQTLGGLAVLVIGARLLVTSASEIARGFGVSEAVIGLTVVAVGTSLPELATSAIAALRRQTDIAVGNVVGSNIFNILGILGATAVISPIATVDPRFLAVDFPWVMATAAGVAVVALAIGRLPRWGGALLLAIYAGYVALML
ncbi:MAG: calcium/sodium antiporter [Anaerolineae bacterium]|nr:calcium/sodium antiporter [Anaerolineae bacterium]